MKRVLVVAGLLLVTASCGPPTVGPAGDGPRERAEPRAEAEPSGDPVAFSNPTPVVLDLAGGDAVLRPWSWCLGSGCVDGMPPEDLTVVDGASVEFTFDRPGWDFDATFKETGVDCPRTITVETERLDDTSFRIAPAGPAGSWDVDLFGRGPGGDVITTFHWDTPADGTLPGAPVGSAAVLADHDGELDSYGVEVGVRDLAEQPDRATATVTVTSSSGEQVTLETHRGRGCYDQGSLWFTAGRGQGLRATTIGPGPFTYEVRLVLDGEAYTGTGTWPDDETAEIAPHVPLAWTPQLPEYSG